MTFRGGESGSPQQLLPIVRLDDYGIERLLLRGSTCRGHASPYTEDGKNYHWKQLVQLSACRCIYEVLKQSSGVDLDVRIERAVGRYWTNRHKSFHSGEHFLQIRHIVARHIHHFLSRQNAGQPMVLFEKYTVYIDQLDMELEQTLHIVASVGLDDRASYIVQKFVVDDDPQTLELFARMTTVFGTAAFRRMPERIEALSLLSGKRYILKPDRRFFQQSMSYMHLVKSLLPNSSEACATYNGTVH